MFGLESKDYAKAGLTMVAVLAAIFVSSLLIKK